MSLTEDQIRHVAHLARLQINDEEIPIHTKNLSNILDLVEQMNTVNTDNVKPMAHPVDLVQPLRPDIVTETNVRDVMQKIAPNTQDGLYLVPKVIDEG